VWSGQTVSDFTSDVVTDIEILKRGRLTACPFCYPIKGDSIHDEVEGLMVLPPWMFRSTDSSTKRDSSSKKPSTARQGFRSTVSIINREPAGAWRVRNFGLCFEEVYPAAAAAVAPEEEIIAAVGERGGGSKNGRGQAYSSSSSGRCVLSASPH
jgi:hypothetical protein